MNGQASLALIKIDLRGIYLSAFQSAVWNAMLAAGLRKSDLARRLSWHMPQVDRLFDVRHGSRFESMEQAASDVAEEEAIRLSQKISWTSLLATISPLLGLLGTVSGMLGSFGIIERTTNPTPAQLGGGIKEALVTTLLGLVVAIPLSVGFFYFKNKVVKIVLEVGAIWEDLLDRFRPGHQQAS